MRPAEAAYSRHRPFRDINPASERGVVAYDVSVSSRHFGGDHRSCGVVGRIRIWTDRAVRKAGQGPAAGPGGACGPGAPRAGDQGRAQLVNARGLAARPPCACCSWSLAFLALCPHSFIARSGLIAMIRLERLPAQPPLPIESDHELISFLCLSVISAQTRFSRLSREKKIGSTPLSRCGQAFFRIML